MLTIVNNSAVYIYSLLIRSAHSLLRRSSLTAGMPGCVFYCFSVLCAAYSITNSSSSASSAGSAAPPLASRRGGAEPQKIEMIFDLCGVCMCSFGCSYLIQNGKRCRGGSAPQRRELRSLGGWRRRDVI